VHVVVFGAGSLGSLIGGLLARAHDVTLVGRGPAMERVREHGLRIEGALTATARPAARTSPVDADAALVTVKAYDTATAAEALSTREYDAVCSLQNGVGNEETLAERVDTPVLAGTVTYGARLREPGVLECTGVGEAVLGAREGGESGAADRLGRAFRAAGIGTTVATDMPRRLWEKLAVNAGVNPTTALARVQNGAVAEGPATPVVERAASECARVAPVGIDPGEAATRALAVARTAAANRSSMLQDVEAGRRTEIDAICGAVVERADGAAPTNATLAALIEAWERERGLR
jgi:2-dehydropantoate 2-reductase